MNRIFGLTALIALIAGAAWLIQRGAEERAALRVMDEIQTAALAGLNQRRPDALDEYFATPAEGGLEAGLAETQQAYKDFVAQLPGNNAVQFHSFDITALQVHEEAGLARVTYRLHFSVLRSGQAMFSAKATQNIALLKTQRGCPAGVTPALALRASAGASVPAGWRSRGTKPRGWRIMGGDAPQLEDVTGNWPPR